MTAILEQHTVLPPADTAEVKRLGSLPRHNQAKLVSSDGTELTLPDEVYAVLREVAAAMAQGLAVTIAPSHAVLTTQQAADMLNISRPTLVKLLEAGEIPFDQIGRHRKVRLADLLEYQKRSRRERRKQLDDLTRHASEDGSADDIDGFIPTR